MEKKNSTTKVIPVPNSDISHYTRQTLTKGEFAVTDNQYPTAVIRNAKGGVLGSIQLSLDTELIDLSREERTAFQTHMLHCIEKMSPATADVFDIVMAHWAKHAQHVTDRVEINVDDVLGYRGKQKVLNGNKELGGYRSRQREEVARQFKTLAYTYIEATGVGYDDKKREKKLRVKCPVIVITGEYSVRDAVTDHTDFIKINYGLGDYFANVMLGNKEEGIPRQVAYLPTPVLNLDPYRQGHAKNLGRYINFLWKNRQRNGSYCDPIKVNTLITNGMKWDISKVKPWQVKERFEAAMDVLEETGAIREWKYPATFEIEALPKRGWLNQWLDIAIEIEPPANVLEQYANIQQPGKLVKKAKADCNLIQQMKDKRIQEGLSLNQLSEQIGVNVSTLSRWESNKSIPRGKTRKKIENWLNP